DLPQSDLTKAILKELKIKSVNNITEFVYSSTLMLSFKYPSNAFLSKSMFLITPPTSPIEQLLNFNFLY
ncbi:ATPase family protein, partial [human gut metagenome]